MMPLPLAEAGEEQIIKKVGGSQELRQHLADMGFVPGGAVTVVSTIGGNVIVKVSTPAALRTLRVPRTCPHTEFLFSYTFIF